MRTPIHFTRWFLPLAYLTGMWPSRSAVEVDGVAIHVAMGWAFKATLPRTSIDSASVAAAPPWIAGIGVHGWRGTWVVNGALHRMVEIRLREPVRARAIGFPAKVRRVFVSVDAPDELVRAIS